MAEFSARITNVRMKDAVAPSSNVVPIFRDGLVNALTGAGGSMDPRSYNRYFRRHLGFHEIFAAYSGGWVARKIVDKPAREMVREWRNWQAKPDDVSALEKAERQLGIRQKAEKALQLAGLGGAGMVLYVAGDDPMTPLDPKRIAKGALQDIHVWHRSHFRLGLMIGTWGDPWFGHPSYFEVQLQGEQGSAPVRFHPSRVIAFKGQSLPHGANGDWQDAFWGESVVSVVMDAVTNVDTAQNGFAALIKDARNRRLSVPELTKQLATAEGEAAFTKRVSALAMGESMFGVTFLDAGSTKDGSGGEKIDDRQMDWSGMPQLADMYMTAAAGAADMPATVLWGKSPDGMNATGESDLQTWERTVKGRQDLDLRPCMDQLDQALIPSAIGKQADDDGVDWDWRPLSVMSEPEAAKAFSDFMVGFTALVNSETMPMQALEKLIQNKAAESAWFPGTEAVLEGIPQAERFPSQALAKLKSDPSAIEAP